MVGNFLSFAVGIALCQGNREAVHLLLETPHLFPEHRTTLLLMQAINSLFVFLVMPLLYIRFSENAYQDVFDSKISNVGLFLVIVFFLVISYFPLTAYLVKWNESWKLPDFLQEFEAKAKFSEEKIKKITEYLIDFQTPIELFLGFFVIAVLPGIGEELFFRGLLQRTICKLLGNIHIAIWVTGFLFGAFHLQLYGIVPRMLLGVLFGYLYYWSGTLWISMWAHFLNNALTLLLMIALSPHKELIFSESIESIENNPYSLFSLIGVGFMLLLFYRNSIQHKLPS